MSFSPDPAQQLLSAGALERAAGLRRMKAVALGLLILLAVARNIWMRRRGWIR